MIDTENMPKEAKDIYDGIRVAMKFARWAYLAALEEGFTEAQSMEVANEYVRTMMSVGVYMKK